MSGITGSTGATGSLGTFCISATFTGATGSTGINGLSITGATGNTGQIGPLGATGMTGIGGNTGNTGNTGSVGPSGFTGFSPTGLTGATGTTGMTGFSIPGPTGQSGATGIAGIGITGMTGLSIVGLTGPTGMTGVGIQGPQGSTPPHSSGGSTMGSGSIGPSNPVIFQITQTKPGDNYFFEGVVLFASPSQTPTMKGQSAGGAVSFVAMEFYELFPGSSAGSIAMYINSNLGSGTTTTLSLTIGAIAGSTGVGFRGFVTFTSSGTWELVISNNNTITPATLGGYTYGGGSS